MSQLQRDGARYEVLLTRGPGDAISLVRSAVGDGAREIVVLGGDGTVGEVAAGCVRPDGHGMLARDLCVSVIHQGTGGDFARGLGIARNDASAIDVAMHGMLGAVDVGLARFTQLDASEAVVSDPDPEDPTRRMRGFLNCANVGLAAEVVEQVSGRLKQLGSNGAFAAATIRGLARNRRRTVTIRTDEGLDVTTDVVDVIACNGRYMGGGMQVAPDAQLDDGAFDLVTIGAAGRLRLLRTFPKIYRGTHVADPLVRIGRTRGLSISSSPADTAEGVVLDGELVGRTPARFEIIPAGLQVRIGTADTHRRATHMAR